MNNTELKFSNSISYHYRSLEILGRRYKESDPFNKPLFLTDANVRETIEIADISQFIEDLVIQLPEKYISKIFAIKLSISSLKKNKKTLIIDAKLRPSQKEDYQKIYESRLESKLRDTLLPEKGKLEIIVIDRFNANESCHQKLAEWLKLEFPEAQLIVLNCVYELLNEATKHCLSENHKVFYLHAPWMIFRLPPPRKTGIFGNEVRGIDWTARKIGERYFLEFRAAKGGTETIELSSIDYEKLKLGKTTVRNLSNEYNDRQMMAAKLDDEPD